jgi:hypothetical protein
MRDKHAYPPKIPYSTLVAPDWCRFAEICVRARSRPIPDPLGAIADDHDDGVRAEPRHLVHLGPQSVEDLVGVAQARHQRASHDGPSTGRRFDALFGQEQHAGLNLAKVSLLERGKRG